MNTLEGELPRRLKDQEPMNLVVDISDHSIDELTSLGVFDGENRTWAADENQIRNLIRVAKLHALPPIREHDKTDVPKPSIDAVVRASAPDEHGSMRIELIVTNSGHSALVLVGASLCWTYTPPRWGEKSAGQPQVAESGGSVGFQSDPSEGPLAANGQKIFFIDARRCPVLVALLADDVGNDGIEIEIGSDTENAWKVIGDDVVSAVREVAHNALEFEHRRA